MTILILRAILFFLVALFSSGCISGSTEGFEPLAATKTVSESYVALGCTVEVYLDWDQTRAESCHIFIDLADGQVLKPASIEMLAPILEDRKAVRLNYRVLAKEQSACGEVILVELTCVSIIPTYL